MLAAGESWGLEASAGPPAAYPCCAIQSYRAYFIIELLIMQGKTAPGSGPVPAYGVYRGLNTFQAKAGP